MVTILSENWIYPKIWILYFAKWWRHHRKLCHFWNQLKNRYKKSWGEGEYLGVFFFSFLGSGAQIGPKTYGTT